MYIEHQVITAAEANGADMEEFIIHVTAVAGGLGIPPEQVQYDVFDDEDATQRLRATFLLATSDDD